jgi:RNA polymerase sigma-70 factor (ECF subfamily)
MTTVAHRSIRRSALGTGNVGAVTVSSELPVLPGVAIGDEQAVTELWARYASRIRSLGLNLSSFDASFADDLVQETFARLWRSAARFDASLGSEPTFVFTVARRTAVDLWRRDRRAGDQQPLESDDRPPLDRSMAAAIRDEDGIDSVLTGWVVTEALGSLSDPQREVIELAYYQQLSQTEIAARLGIPLGTVKTRTFAALKVLRSALAEHGVLP